MGKVRISKLYNDLLGAVAQFSKLFSNSETPLIPYRASEMLYCVAHEAKDVSRGDNSFDAILKDGITGIGIKTFQATSERSKKLEKIAEFSNRTMAAKLDSLHGRALALEVSKLRNERITNHAISQGLDLSLAHYHCIVRVPGKIFIHEEPYELIDLKNLAPIQKRGKSRAWPSRTSKSVQFTDGKSRYSFHLGKHTLFKEFDLVKHDNSDLMAVKIHDNIVDLVLASGGRETSSYYLKPTSGPFVVLPLYSPKTGQVEAKSGLNQWNASGVNRKRKMMEAYIPIPAEIWKRHPLFFPGIGVEFKLRLPNAPASLSSAKACQQGGKALMTNPNDDLCKWLFELIDGGLPQAEKRFASSRPYTYEDLSRIGFDAVRITKCEGFYELQLDYFGAYDDFINDTYEPKI
jgi:hypothetical protein